MSRAANLSALFPGADRRMRRMVVYWFGALWLYVASTATLWPQVLLDRADATQAGWLTLAQVPGVALFYGLIRTHERLRMSLPTLSIDIDHFKGLAAMRPGDSVAAVLERADRAMYRAKAEGRDRVVHA